MQGVMLFFQGFGVYLEASCTFWWLPCVPKSDFFKHYLSEAVAQQALKAASAHLSIGNRKKLVKKGQERGKKAEFWMPGRSLARKGMSLHLRPCTSHCHCSGDVL